MHSLDGIRSHQFLFLLCSSGVHTNYVFIASPKTSIYAERECMRGARAARVSLLHEKLNSRLIYGNQFMRFDHREGPCFVPVGSLL
jgi:hypothetical protein